MDDKTVENLMLSVPCISRLSEIGCRPIFVAGIAPVGKEKYTGKITWCPVEIDFSVEDIYDACKMFVDRYERGEFKQS